MWYENKISSRRKREAYHNTNIIVTAMILFMHDSLLEETVDKLKLKWSEMFINLKTHAITLFNMYGVHRKITGGNVNLLRTGCNDADTSSPPTQ